MRRCLLLIPLVFLSCSHLLFAQTEQNGLQIEVSRKTMAREDNRNSGFYEQQINRTMALHVTVKNVSMKPFPEGEIDYSLLVHKIYTYPNRVELYTGTVKLPALQPAEEKDVVIGSAQVNGYRDWPSSAKTSWITRS